MTSPVSPLATLREILKSALEYDKRFRETGQREQTFIDGKPATAVYVQQRPVADFIRDALAVLDSLDGTITRLEAVEETAKAFVATTTYYRQPKASRAEFEALALALLAARIEEAG